MTYILSDTTENTEQTQKSVCEKFCENKKISVNGEISLSESDKLFNGDTIICSDFSQFGKTKTEAIQNLVKLLQKSIQIISVKNEISLSGTEAANALLACEEIEKSIHSSSTKAGLEKAKAQGRIGGRKVGQKPKNTKLSKYEDEIKAAYQNGESKSVLARRYKVTWTTMNSFLKNK